MKIHKKCPKCSFRATVATLEVFFRSFWPQNRILRVQKRTFECSAIHMANGIVKITEVNTWITESISLWWLIHNFHKEETKIRIQTPLYEKINPSTPCLNFWIPNHLVNVLQCLYVSHVQMVAFEENPFFLRF